jgi:hypothetical protein
MRSVLIRVAAFFAFTIVFVPAFGPDVQQASACGEVHPKTGDLNADGLTNSLDALAVLTYQAGMMASEPDALWMGGADVDCDGAVTAIDATLILQVDAGLTTIRP